MISFWQNRARYQTFVDNRDLVGTRTWTMYWVRMYLQWLAAAIGLIVIGGWLIDNLPG